MSDEAVILNSIQRADLVLEARTWLGTPYCHQASLKHVGCDCLGLVRGLWRWIEGCEPEEIPGYSSSWSIALPGEALLDAAKQHFIEIDQDQIGVGDIVLFRVRKTLPINHVGIVSASNSFIHAYDGSCVVETKLSKFWRSRLAASFRFPQVEQEIE